jgi:hypothetical protein
MAGIDAPILSDKDRQGHLFNDAPRYA